MTGMVTPRRTGGETQDLAEREEKDRERFMEELEEDEDLRKNVNFYRDESVPLPQQGAPKADEDSGELCRACDLVRTSSFIGTSPPASSTPLRSLRRRRRAGDSTRGAFGEAGHPGRGNGGARVKGQGMWGRRGV